MSKQARSRLVIADMTRLPFAERSIRAVTGNAILDVITASEVGPLVAEVDRVLTTEGVALLSDIGENYKLLKRQLEQKGLHEDWGVFER